MKKLSLKKEKVLIIVAHTDDETFGMGGSILYHKNKGDDIYAISLTDGVSSRNNFTKEEIKRRSLSKDKSSKMLGFKWFCNGNFPDNSLDSVPLLEIIKFIEKVKIELKPTLIYTHSCADLNIDHRKVNEALLVAFRPLANETWNEVRTFEVPSSTDYGHSSVTNLFNPNLYINISDNIELKLEALKIYEEELKDYPNSRSIEGLRNLAMFRGNQVGLEYAEAFEIIRKIIR